MSQLLIGLNAFHGANSSPCTASDAIAHYLHEQHGLMVIRIGEPFEAALAALLNKSHEQVRNPANGHLSVLASLPHTNNAYEPRPTLRSTVHALRHEFAHSLHPDFITALLEQRLQEAAAMHSDAAGFVVPDLVFADEADFIRSHDGLVIHIRGEGLGLSWTHYGRSPIQSQQHDLTLQWHGTMRDLQPLLDTNLSCLRAVGTI